MRYLIFVGIEGAGAVLSGAAAQLLRGPRHLPQDKQQGNSDTHHGK